MVPASVRHRVVHPKAPVDGPEWYRSRNRDDGDVFAAEPAMPLIRAFAGRRAGAQSQENRHARGTQQPSAHDAACYRPTQSRPTVSGLDRSAL